MILKLYHHIHTQIQNHFCVLFLFSFVNKLWHCEVCKNDWDNIQMDVSFRSFGRLENLMKKWCNIFCCFFHSQKSNPYHYIYQFIHCMYHLYNSKTVFSFFDTCTILLFEQMTSIFILPSWIIHSLLVYIYFFVFCVLLY